MAEATPELVNKYQAMLPAVQWLTEFVATACSTALHK
jgi:hypothetical protein